MQLIQFFFIFGGGFECFVFVIIFCISVHLYVSCQLLSVVCTFVSVVCIVMYSCLRVLDFCFYASIHTGVVCVVCFIVKYCLISYNNVSYSVLSVLQYIYKYYNTFIMSYIYKYQVYLFFIYLHICTLVQ